MKMFKGHWSTNSPGDAIAAELPAECAEEHLDAIVKVIEAIIAALPREVEKDIAERLGWQSEDDFSKRFTVEIERYRDSDEDDWQIAASVLFDGDVIDDKQFDDGEEEKARAWAESTIAKARKRGWP